MKLTVADDRRCLQRDGKPFFWLADTLWSAFTNMTDEELESYLILRRQQGSTCCRSTFCPSGTAAGPRHHACPGLARRTVCLITAPP